MDVGPTGRREATKQAQRRAVRHTAMTLFLEHGFDAVTTTHVAIAAGVSPATVFNYFATKEDLFFGQIEELEAALVEVVRSCAVGSSVMVALRGHVMYELTAGRAYTDPAAVGPFHQQVARSQRLQNREAEIYQHRELVLADVLPEILGCRRDPTPARLVAAMYIAAERLIAGELRRRMTATSPRRALATIDPFIDQVFNALRAGVGDVTVIKQPTR